MFASKMKIGILAFTLFSVFSMFVAPLQALELKPHKDRLFKNRKPIEVKDNGDFLRLPYDPDCVKTLYPLKYWRPSPFLPD